MAAARQDDERQSLLLHENEPLIGVFMIEDGREVVRYFTNEQSADEALAGIVADPLQLAGAWSDLDWDEIEVALARIRHESPPSAPLSI